MRIPKEMAQSSLPLRWKRAIDPVLHLLLPLQYLRCLEGPSRRRTRLDSIQVLVLEAPCWVFEGFENAESALELVLYLTVLRATRQYTQAPRHATL